MSNRADCPNCDRLRGIIAGFEHATWDKVDRLDDVYVPKALVYKYIMENYHANEPEVTMKWEWQGSIYFAATILTTIGYGNFAPCTDGSKWVLIWFAIPSIGLFGFCLSQIATMLLLGLHRIKSLVSQKIASWRQVRYKRTDEGTIGKWAKVMRKYDVDQSNTLSLEEMISAVLDVELEVRTVDHGQYLTLHRALEKKCRMTAEEWYAETDDAILATIATIKEELVDLFVDHHTAEDGTIDLVEGVVIMNVVADRRRFQLRKEEVDGDISLLIAMVLLTICLGTVVFHATEGRKYGWDWVDSLYFCIITSTSVGLGDYTPTSAGKGSFVNLFAWLVYVVFTMGLVGSLISKVSEGTLDCSTVCVRVKTRLAGVKAFRTQGRESALKQPERHTFVSTRAAQDGDESMPVLPTRSSADAL
jgi:hypothetical protein